MSMNTSILLSSEPSCVSSVVCSTRYVAHSGGYYTSLGKLAAYPVDPSSLSNHIILHEDGDILVCRSLDGWTYLPLLGVCDGLHWLFECYTMLH